jgi:hypothetical protein
MADDWFCQILLRKIARALGRAVGPGRDDRRDQARAYLASIHKTLPRYRVEDFLTAMQFAPEGEKLFRLAAKRIAKA